jgi:hypothetical protein
MLFGNEISVDHCVLMTKKKFEILRQLEQLSVLFFVKTVISSLALQFQILAI